MSSDGDGAKPESVQQALRDIAIIRRCIEQSHEGRSASSGALEQSRRLQLLLHCTLFVLSALILVVELLSGGVNTHMLLLSRTDEQLRYVGLMNVGLFLIVLSYIFYFIVTRAARDRLIATDQFIAKHFSYLSHLSLFTDLFLKFVMFSLLVYAGRPEWIAPLLLLFIGDYLMQGRLFVFPLRIGLLLGLLVTASGFLCFYYQCASLALPLTAFVAVTLFSWTYLLIATPHESPKMKA